MATPAPGPALEAAIGLLFDRFCLWTVIAGATLFWQRVNASGPAWSSLAASSYGIYYVRPLILYPLAYLLGGVALPIAIKAPALIVTTVLAAWGFTALVLRRLPGLRRIF